MAESPVSPLILVIDDDQQLLNLHRLMLARLCPTYTVLTEVQVTSAIARLVRVPDVILCDTIMPGMYGFEFFEIVKRSPL